MKEKINKVVLAYSGGLDTSVIAHWIKTNYKCEVICFCANLGQGEELSGLEEKALASGASKLYIRDLTEEFIKDFVFPTLRAGAVYERDYLLGTSFARPLISKHMVDIAAKEGADAIAHGATGKGNDQVRFEVSVMALNPELKTVAPWREWDIKGREDALAYAAKHGIPVSQTKKDLYSRDRNIFHLSHEGGILEDTWAEPEESMFQLSKSPEAAPDKPIYIEIGFEKGNPTSINGKKTDPVELFTELNKIGGEHGIGRIDIVENRLVGMKSRGVYETPAGTMLLKAHQALESITLDKYTLQYKDILAMQYAKLVYEGLWFTRLRKSLDAFVEVSQENVTGTVRVKLYKGNIIIVGSKSEKSLYHAGYASFEKEEVYNQQDAEGFISLFGLPLKVEALTNKTK
ncbi:MAG: argininosuccinate synthase [Deltaproteobacteria bacterium]|nr:argininosuccinate synthase [Deltaproteobacteria bacterium]